MPMQRVYDRIDGTPYDYPDTMTDQQIAADMQARRAGQQGFLGQPGTAPGGHGMPAAPGEKASPWALLAQGAQQMSGLMQQRAAHRDIPDVPPIPGGAYAFAGSQNVNAALDRRQRMKEATLQAQQRQDQMVQAGLQQEKRLSAQIQLEELREKNRDRREKLRQKQQEQQQRQSEARGNIYNTGQGLIHAGLDPDTGQPWHSTIVAAPQRPIRVGNALVDPETYQPVYEAPQPTGAAAPAMAPNPWTNVREAAPGVYLGYNRATGRVEQMPTDPAAKAAAQAAGQQPAPEPEQPSQLGGTGGDVQGILSGLPPVDQQAVEADAKAIWANRTNIDAGVLQPQTMTEARAMALEHHGLATVIRDKNDPMKILGVRPVPRRGRSGNAFLDRHGIAAQPRQPQVDGRAYMNILPRDQRP